MPNKPLIAVPFKGRMIMPLNGFSQIHTRKFRLKPLLFVGYPLAKANGNEI